MTELNGLGVRTKVQMNRLRPHYKEDVTHHHGSILLAVAEKQRSYPEVLVIHGASGFTVPSPWSLKLS